MVYEVCDRVTRLSDCVRREDQAKSGRPRGLGKGYRVVKIKFELPKRVNSLPAGSITACDVFPASNCRGTLAEGGIRTPYRSTEKPGTG